MLKQCRFDTIDDRNKGIAGNPKRRFSRLLGEEIILKGIWSSNEQKIKFGYFLDIPRILIHENAKNCMGNVQKTKKIPDKVGFLKIF